MTDRKAPNPSIATNDALPLPTTDALGVDLTPIRATLRMTPTARLKALESYMNTLVSVKVIRRATDDGASR